MAFTFCSSNGGLYNPDGTLLACGYSGHGEGVNNPQLEREPRLGPIPRGDWLIEGPPFDSAEHGPFVLRLEPAKGTPTFGRSGFLIHGDSVRHPGDASLGCIIVPRRARESIWASGDRQLSVSAQPPQPQAVA